MSDTQLMLPPQHVHDLASAFAIITCVVLQFNSALMPFAHTRLARPMKQLVSRYHRHARGTGQGRLRL